MLSRAVDVVRAAVVLGVTTEARQAMIKDVFNTSGLPCPCHRFCKRKV